MSTEALTKKTSVRDMTEGSIVKQLVLFALPLMLGNVFQMLYNTVDSVVVGNFVGKQALAAIGSTTMLVNMMVFFFNGFSIGAGVVISSSFGSRDMKKLHIAVETTICATFIISLIFTVMGVMLVETALHLMSTPEDVFDQAAVYLKIYISGISGLLLYNMCSGILRAVGDSKHPLYFLIFTSLLNIALDLVFVLVLKMGIAGVAIATIISQFTSALLTLRLITVTDDIYKLTWNDLAIDWPTLRKIFSIGLPAGIQSVITSVSNMFVQSYINFFGSDCMAGWSSYNKLDSFVMLPMQSMAMAATTFVSQNIGAGKQNRANRGTIACVSLTLSVTAVIVALLYTFAAPAVKLFSPDSEVIRYGVMFLHTNTVFFLLNCMSHVLAGAIRGKGDSRGPMIIMISGFVVVRQIYLFVITRFVANTARLVGFGYPVGWTVTALSMITYFFVTKNKAPLLKEREA